LDVKIEHTLPDDKWIVTIDDDAPMEFDNRTYALIYLNNRTLMMVIDKQ